MASPADLRAAIRKADQACPCYLRQRQCGASKPGMLSTGCKCWPSIQQDPRERIADPECIAPGHAAVREAMWAVLDAAASVPEEWLKHPSCEPGTPCTHIRMAEEVAKRIRALDSILGPAGRKGEVPR